MPVVLVLTDFDGTITGISGSHVVKSKFFRSLTEITASSSFDYTQAKMKSDAEIDALFVEEFGSYASRETEAKGDGRFLMSDDVVRFMHEALSGDEVQIHIITLNRPEYVRAQFRYHDFTQTEIDKVKISALLNKEYVVNRDLAMMNLVEICQIYVLDDSLDDFNAMRKAVIGHGLETRLVAFNGLPGTFDWNQYSLDIKTAVANTKIQRVVHEQTFLCNAKDLFFNQAQDSEPEESSELLIASLNINI